MRRETAYLWLWGAAGLVARLVVAWFGKGTNDVDTWAQFAGAIAESGVGRVYDVLPDFNHPPLMGWLAWGARAVSEASGARFDFVWKLPAIAADLAAAVVLLRLRSLAVGVAYWLTPAAILVSAYHGNTDAICAALALAAVACLERGRAGWAGVLLGAAVNVKLIPLLLLPLLAGAIGSQQGPPGGVPDLPTGRPVDRRWLRFALGLSCALVPFVPFAILHWPGFSAHVLHYRSHPMTWGITLLFFSLRHTALAEAAGAANAFYLAHGAQILLGVLALLGAWNLRARRWPAVPAAAAAMCLFLVLAPGFGVQYVVYPLALLYAADASAASACAAAASAYTVMLYAGLWTHAPGPAFSDFRVAFPPWAQLAGGVLWLLCAWAAWRLLGRDVRTAR